MARNIVEHRFVYRVSVEITHSSPKVAQALYDTARCYQAICSPGLSVGSLSQRKTNLYVIDTAKERAETRKRGLEKALAEFPFVKDITVGKVLSSSSITTVLEHEGHA